MLRTFPRCKKDKTMTDNERLKKVAAIPTLGSMLLKAATIRKKKQPTPEFLPIAIAVDGVRVNARKLEKFCDICGFSNGDKLPLTYPHIMAFALQLQVMLEPEFPFAPMGAIHLRNRIRQQRALRAGELLDFKVRFDRAELVDKGYEVSFITEVRVAGELVWDDLSVILLRKGGGGGKRVKRTSVKNGEYGESLTWELAANKGRQYAAASGDYNPIHLYSTTARLMGFKRQIMHGMWSKSRTVSHLLPADYDGPVSVDVSFKLPILLPATVTLMFDSDTSGSQFEMKDGRGKIPHLAGELLLGEGIPA
jgi:acyl dehydratase